MNKQLLTRFVVVLTLLLGTLYVGWRWIFSVNWPNWWIAVPLVVAETYALIDTYLFGLTVWRIKRRGPAPEPTGTETVDVFITTLNEPVELVAETARAATRISYPHETWILDDGDRPEMRAAAAELGVGYITRTEDWHDRPRHAKAGNLNNALFATHGEFMLILDADQIPVPEILDRTLGWFQDPEVALVQTPQWFTNVTESDPLGSQAELFYGPIQQGKDGWNAAFFCGSNAVLRREALMQLGIVGYVREVESAVADALRTSSRLLATAGEHAEAHGPAAVAAVQEVADAATVARADLAAGTPVSRVTYAFQQRVDASARLIVDEDLAAIRADLLEIGALRRRAAVRRAARGARRGRCGAGPAGLARHVAADGHRVGAPARARRRRRPPARGAADDADGDPVGHRGHGDLHAAARDGLALGLPPRGAGPRPGARRPRHHAAAAAALGAGHPAGDAQGEPAGAEGPEHPAAAHVLLDDVELPVRLRGRRRSSPRPSSTSSSACCRSRPTA